MKRCLFIIAAMSIASAVYAGDIGVCMVRELLPTVPAFYESAQRATKEALSIASDEMTLREKLNEKAADVQKRAAASGRVVTPSSPLAAEMRAINDEFEKWGRERQRREAEIEKMKARAFQVTKEILDEASNRVMKKRKLNIILDVDSVLGYDKSKVVDVTDDIKEVLAKDRDLLNRKEPSRGWMELPASYPGSRRGP